MVDKALDIGRVDRQNSKPNTKKNKIISRFKATRIWPLNLRAMDHKTSPSTLYTLFN